jgi:hypothetical protein
MLTADRTTNANTDIEKLWAELAELTRRLFPHGLPPDLVEILLDAASHWRRADPPNI